MHVNPNATHVAHEPIALLKRAGFKGDLKVFELLNNIQH